MIPDQFPVSEFLLLVSGTNGTGDSLETNLSPVPIIILDAFSSDSTLRKENLFCGFKPTRLMDSMQAADDHANCSQICQMFNTTARPVATRQG
jgi:hypothetical protein